jgi:hypothetical protein
LEDTQSYQLVIANLNATKSSFNQPPISSNQPLDETAKSNHSGEILEAIKEEENLKNSRETVSRRIRMKSSDMSKSFTDFREKRQ